MQRKQHNRIFSYVAAAATVAIAAALVAVGAPVASAATRTINVSGVITGFSQSTINVTAGEALNICLKSTDIDHDLTITSLGFKVASKGGGPAVCGTLTAPTKVGSSAFICSIPGHAAAGMKGNLVVKAAGSSAPTAPKTAPKAGAPAGGDTSTGAGNNDTSSGAQADAPAGGVGAGGGSTAGLTHVSLLTLGGGLLIAAMMTALLGVRVTRRN